MSIPLLLVYTFGIVGCGFLPYPSTIDPFKTGQGKRPLFDSKFLLNAALSFVSVITNFLSAGFAEAVDDVVPLFPEGVAFASCRCCSLRAFASASAISFSIACLIRRLSSVFWRSAVFKSASNFDSSFFNLFNACCFFSLSESILFFSSIFKTNNSSFFSFSVLIELISVLINRWLCLINLNCLRWISDTRRK